MHLKKSEVQISEESFGFSSDFRPPPLLQIHISNPSSNYGSSVHGLPSATTPHKRPVMSQSPPAAAVASGTAAHCRPISAVRQPNSTFRRVLFRLPFSPATRSNLRHLVRRLRFRLRLVFILSFPFLYFLFVSFSFLSPPPPSSLERSFLLDFVSAVTFISAIFLILSLSLNYFSLSSLRLLLSRSSSLLPRYYRISSRPVQWSIGSSIEKPKSNNESKISGFSTMVYSNGDVFEGEFHKGRCSGSGVYYYHMSGRYEGDWVDSKYDGYGIETWARGSRYKGQYRQGYRNGYGVYQFYNGDVYAGEWLKGQSHGNGLQHCEDGSSYVGEFNLGLKHGLGHYNFRYTN